MSEYEETFFSLPHQHIPYYNVVTSALHRAAISRGLTKDKFPDFCEALYLVLKPDLKKKVDEWRKNEEEKIEKKVWEETGDKKLAKLIRYDKLLEKIVEVLDSTGMFTLHVRKTWGRERGME